VLKVLESVPRSSAAPATVDSSVLLAQTKVFPFIKWIKANKQYIVQEYDCCLPQNDHHLAERREELAAKKKIFRYGIKINPPHGPVQVTKQDNKSYVVYIIYSKLPRNS
jgi:hypothetical protein